jgi:hypothetical protein
MSLAMVGINGVLAREVIAPTGRALGILVAHQTTPPSVGLGEREKLGENGQTPDMGRPSAPYL